MNIEKNKQSGQGMVEYALILALIAVVVIVAVSVVGQNASEKMSSVAASLSGSPVSYPTMGEARDAFCAANPGVDQNIDLYSGSDGYIVAFRVNGEPRSDLIAAGYNVSNTDCR